MKKVARVLIVGRTNIGKSTLFNRLSTSVKSLIFEQEGVTRDYIKDVVVWKGVEFELVDSAGLSFRKSQDPLMEKIRLQALSLLDTAMVIIFVVDGTVGILPEDYEISKAVHKTGRSTLLVINKMDHRQAQEQVHEFVRLGYDQQLPISAIHATGIVPLLDAVVEALAQVPQMSMVESGPLFKVVLLGKPNVGKSSLMNALLQEQRSLVTDIPGTTREAIKETIQFYQETIELTDTPGVRRKRAVEEDLETLMVKSSLSAVREADVVLLLLDSSQGILADQELKLAYYAFEQRKKALIVLFNKSDLMNNQRAQELSFNLEPYEHFLKKIVQLHISCKTGKNVGKILSTVHEVWQRFNKEFSQQELVILFKQALARSPLFKSGQPLKLFSAKQIKKAPLTIVLYVNEPDWFGPSQRGFFENVLRGYTDLKSVPVEFIVRRVSL
jgi:GTP-binding protein